MNSVSWYVSKLVSAFRSMLSTKWTGNKSLSPVLIAIIILFPNHTVDSYFPNNRTLISYSVCPLSRTLSSTTLTPYSTYLKSASLSSPFAINASLLAFLLWITKYITPAHINAIDSIPSEMELPIIYRGLSFDG
jgi:hypothetical protein